MIGFLSDVPQKQFHWLGALAGGAFSGVLYAFAYPPLRWSLLAWVAFLPLYLTLRDAGKRQGGWQGFGFGFALFLVGANWVNAAGIPPWIILSVIMGTQFAVFGLIMGTILPRVSLTYRPLLFACLYTLTEWVRSQGGYAFPWFVGAATQAHNLLVLQVVSLTGQWGLAFALALTSAFLGEVWVNRAEKRAMLRWMVATVAVPAICFVLGGGLLAQENSRQPLKANQRTVAIVQGSFLEPSPGGDYASEALLTYLNLTRSAILEHGKPFDLLIWPEAVTPDNLLLDNYSLPPLTALAKATETSLLIGTTHEENELRYNSAVLLNRVGEPLGRYDKTHVVPVGEFFPFRPLLQTIYLQYNVPSRDLAPGRLPNVLTLPRPSGEQDRIGVMICYDVAFPWDGRKGVLRGAQYWSQLTADTPFEATSRPEQHADLTSVRTVETRRWMIRAALSGISQVVDPTGREVARLPLMARQTLTHTIELRNDKTLFVRLGDWFIVVCAVIAVIHLAPHPPRKSDEERQPESSPIPTSSTSQ
jgi:apolipoprotein N-acyltransferase